MKKYIINLRRNYLVWNLLMFWKINRPLAYERVYLSLFKVADTLFHIQGKYMPNSKTVPTAVIASNVFQIEYELIRSHGG